MTCAHDHLQALDRQEQALGITSCWTVETPEYLHIIQESRLHDYQAAVDRLEYLVVQRMFELTKLGMSGVGMCKDVLYIFFRSFHIFSMLQDASEDRAGPKSLL